MVAGGVRGTAERDEAEEPLLRHLKAMGWQHIRGRDLQDAEKRAYTDFLLRQRLVTALRRINRMPGALSGWMSEGDELRAVDRLKQAARNVAASSLAAANEEVTTLLVHGALEKGPDERDAKVWFVDWGTEALEGTREEVLARNDFLVVDQLRVRNAGGKDEVLDLVLFVNGIPVVVIECKSPDKRDPLTEAIRDLRAYTGRPLADDTREPATAPRGIPEFFAPVQLLVAADGRDAALGTISSEEEHYALWRSVEPDYASPDELRRELRAWGVIGADEPVTLQHQLTAMVLKPANLLNIIRHYVFEMPLKSQRKARKGDREKQAVVQAMTAKVVCRHQQYRATEKIVRKLRTGRTRLDPGAERDERGGVVWHTQGAGKSFTMKFLARRLHMSRDPELNQVTLVAVTDRKDLQRQLKNAVKLSGSTVHQAKSQADLEGMLRRAGQPGGRAVIFATIQKFLGELPGLPKDSDGADGADTANGEDEALAEDFDQARDRVEAGEDPEQVADPAPDEETLKKAARVFPECSDSVKVLVMVDEAHRSHTSVLHACLRTALPNAARIGFTGTPLMQGRRKDTGRIFGFEPSREPGGRPAFLDTYRMVDAEADKVIVPVKYEGRATTAEVREKQKLNDCFEDLIEPLDASEQQRVRKFYGTPTGRDVAESAPLIRAKAADMLAHYVTGPLTKGFKAQVAVVSRRAAVYYRNAFRDVRTELLERVREFDESGAREALRLRKPETYSDDELLLFWAWRHREVLRRMDFVPVISAGREHKSGVWREWTDESKQREHVDRFLDPFPEYPPGKEWTAIDLPPTIGRVGGMNPWSDLAPHRETEEEPEPIAFLIVKSMLLTGFDAPIEQVLYLDRPIRDAELLQAIARVNRPAPEKTEGLVVDYYGVLNNLGVTLAAYRNDPPVLESLRSMDAEIPRMKKAAEEVEAFLSAVGIDREGLGTRAGIARAMLALGDSRQRAELDRLLGEFLGAVDRVLPHEGALEWIPDVRRWSVLQMRVRRHYRDGPGGGFSIRGYGRKVRALIADHLAVQEIEQAIAPVSLLAPDFDQIVDRLPVREAAAEQVQALRYHLEERQEREDRPVYRQLAAELEKVLEEFAGRWEDIKAHVGPLVERARRAEQADPRLADLSPMEQRLYVLLQERLTEDPGFETPEPDFLRRLAAEVREEIVGHVTRASFGAEDAHVTELEAHIWNRLRRAGLRPVAGGREALERLAGSLAGHAVDHLDGFRAEGRRQ
ncbi:DEAD/DEAH box helicase family protein [Streptomyces sp. SCA3-4]|uniref:type I restriction endonuclease subunit R n=1 Tax=Streptomyces sichuanensis TaxID=2871810 RepID=UPI001CE3293B|nr:type I restriction endonuclease [Streptomyces sichuanensis]MCA6094312.1 DEAD/DEAH box helicase family protein [Streptomyces sichuanensis]